MGLAQEVHERPVERRFGELAERPGDAVERPYLRKIGHGDGECRPGLRPAQLGHDFGFAPAFGFRAAQRLEHPVPGGIRTVREQLERKARVAQDGRGQIGAVAENRGENPLPIAIGREIGHL